MGLGHLMHNCFQYLRWHASVRLLRAEWVRGGKGKEVNKGRSTQTGGWTERQTGSETDGWREWCSGKHLSIPLPQSSSRGPSQQNFPWRRSSSAGFFSPASTLLASSLHLFPRPSGTHAKTRTQTHTHTGIGIYYVYSQTHTHENIYTHTHRPGQESVRPGRGLFFMQLVLSDIKDVQFSWICFWRLCFCLSAGHLKKVLINFNEGWT